MRLPLMPRSRQTLHHDFFQGFDRRFTLDDFTSLRAATTIDVAVNVAVTMANSLGLRCDTPTGHYRRPVEGRRHGQCRLTLLYAFD